jgi:hypothetical protein
MRAHLVLVVPFVLTACGSDSSGPEDGGHLGPAGTPTTHHLSIRFDYRFDTAGFFGDAQRQALEAAAAAWSAVLSDDFDAIPAGTELRLRNPEDRDTDVWVTLDEPIDDVLVFVGTTEDMVGVGRGGTSMVAFSDDSALQDQLTWRVQGDPFQPWAGSTSFRASAEWFFDPTPETDDDIPVDATDFISIATHELGHVLGVPDAMLFAAQVSGNKFAGPNAVAVYGAQVPLSADGGHLQDGLLVDGKEPLMDPSTTDGTRKRPTALDVAILEDLGFAAD